MVMLKKKCSSCAKKIERKFNYCPYCGASFKAGSEREDFGMLGRDDIGAVQEELKLPFGLDKMMGSLIKQLERQMGEMDFEGQSGFPKGFQVRISKGKPLDGRGLRVDGRKQEIVKVSKEEGERRAKLPRVEVEAKIKRLGDTIIYEIETPGVKGKEGVVLNKLEAGLEIKAYSEDKCYVKVIPFKVEVLGYRVSEEKVFVEIKG